tara:strand:+ start:959 stop:1312 length:354 start_codon:yes stop_codon:yes gene_type:complete
MKHKVKHSNLVITIILASILINVISIPMAIISEYYSFAVVLALILIILCFVGGYRCAVHDKNDDIDINIRQDLEHNIINGISNKSKDLSLDGDDIRILRKIANKRIQVVLDEYLDIN